MVRTKICEICKKKKYVCDKKYLLNLANEYKLSIHDFLELKKLCYCEYPIR